MKRQLKKSVVYGLYAFAFIFLVGGIAILSSSIKRLDDAKYQYVSKGILDYEEKIPVVQIGSTILRPYNNLDINIVKNYYDYKSESEEQEKSLIYYEGTYIQSSGISYSNGSSFDVVSILNGNVTEVKNDTTLGNVITIDHGNGIISVYQSVTDIMVQTGDNVMAGQIIAKSGTSNISKELDNHLYFELIINGACVNPESYYGKSIDQI